MSDLAAFISARLDEDEAQAREMKPEVVRFFTGDPERPEFVLVDGYIRRALREVEAKRKLLELLRSLAVVYSDHPDYDKDWG